MKNKLIAKLFVTFLICFCISFVGNFIKKDCVYASSSVSFKDEFDLAYSEFESLDFENEGKISNANYQEYIDKSLSVLEISLTEKEKNSIKNYSSKFTNVFKSYKNAKKEYVKTLYVESEYCDTSEGIIKLHNDIDILNNSINTASSYQDVDTLISEFSLKLIDGNYYSKNLEIVSTKSSDKIVAVVVAENKIFAKEDYIIAEEYKISYIRKNLQVALKNDKNLLGDNFGLAYFIDLKLCHNQVYQDLENTNLQIKININELGFSIKEDTKVQVARYLKNQTCELYECSVVDGYIVFNANGLGQFGIVLDGYKLQEEHIFLAFLKKYGFIILGGFAILFAFVIAIKIIKKKRKKQKEKDEKSGQDLK